MNVFVIPSWYPSQHNALNGIFIKDQVMGMAKMYPDINFGVSTWGQNDEKFLLYSREPLKSIRKLLKAHRQVNQQICPNVQEYFTPAYSFTDKLFSGNIKRTVEANIKNFEIFQSQFGKPDLIHAHVCYKAGYIAQQISRKFNVPYILTEHMGPFPQKYHLDKKGSLLPSIKESIEKADTLIAVSSDLSEVMRSYGIANDIEVIPNFIDHISTSKQKISGDKFSFITISGMSLGKGMKELLYGISIALRSDTKLHFTMVGGGPDLDYLKSLSVELNISKNITWTGMVAKKHVSSYLANAQAHILVSHYDSFGVAYIEAMAHGLPSIAAALGGPRDIIDEQTGVLIDQVEPELIADQILWMKGNYHHFDQKEIVTSFQERFSTQAVAPQIRKVYERLILS